MNDVVITKFREEDQFVELHAGDRYVAMQVHFDRDPVGVPAIIIGPGRAMQLGFALLHAAVRSWRGR